LRLKLAIAVAAIGALAVPLIATAGSPTDRATGGGQILIDQKPGNGVGAGDTIAFSAQQVSGTVARGQVQFVDRTGGIGKDQVKEHGEVFCMAMMGANVAEIGYDPRGDADDVDQLYVIDNGAPGQGGTDMIFVDDNPETPCDFQDDSDDDGEVALARGNVTLYNAP
jgi:hypothetical protein